MTGPISTVEESARLLQTLVSIPSVNPVFRKPNDESGVYGEARMADFLESWAKEHGFACERQGVLPGRENVLIRLSGGMKHLVWEAHMDTVQIDNMTVDPFAGEIRDGRLYGRGACDTKASLCAMMLALRHLAGQASRPTVTLAATVDEEYNYRGVLHLVKSGFRADAGVVGEPTKLNLAVAHRGCVRFSIVTRGRACHSSRAEEGVNAIEHMSWLLMGLADLRKLLSERKHALVAPPTLSVTVIQGGTGVNTVPDRCEVKVDRRINPGETPEEAMAEIRNWVDKIASVHPELQAEVGEPFVVDFPMEVSRMDPVVLAMLRGMEQAGIIKQVVGVPYGTDASKLVMYGIPAVVFGPGSIEDAHTADESVALREVLQAATALSAGALAFAGKANDPSPTCHPR